MIDLKELERNLIQYKDRPLKIGSFSAASNVTGVKTETKKVSSLLHKYGALSFWDYAAAAPHAEINMNPVEEYEGYSCHYDAVFISPHKFVGGPGTPGVLIAKKSLFKNTIPTTPSGGTVLVSFLFFFFLFSFFFFFFFFLSLFFSFVLLFFFKKKSKQKQKQKRKREKIPKQFHQKELLGLCF